jgi:hypothetical protein
MKRTILVAAALAACAACGGPAPNAPASTPLPANLFPASSPGSQITFSGIVSHGAPVSTYTEAGYTVGALGANWVGSTTYGAPAPFIQFMAAPGTTADGRVEITAGGATFKFTSVDLYASITKIPHTINGLRSGATVFSFSGVVPNTFGRFQTVTNPHSDTVIDMLIIKLTNTAPPCCGNPMGVDNLIFGQ